MVERPGRILVRLCFAALATMLCTFAAAAAPEVAGASPAHNHGLTIAATPDFIIAGEGVLIYGQLNGADNADQRIVLYHRVGSQAKFRVDATTTTNAAGFYEFTRADGVVVSDRSWFVRGPDATHSRTISEKVAALVSLTASTASTETGQAVAFSGQVTPSYPGKRLELQVQGAEGGDGWTTVATTLTDASSSFDLSHSWGGPGDLTLRAAFPGDPLNREGVSDSLTLLVTQKENPSFTIASSEPVISAGGQVTISGVLYQPHATTPEPSTQVTLFGKRAGDAFEAVATTVTGPDGSYSFTQSPISNEVYKVSTTLPPHRTSSNLNEGVQDALTIGASATVVAFGGTATLSGGVTPQHAGHVVYLQSLGTDGFWHNVATGVVQTASTYSFTYTFGETGTTQLRARLDGGPDNVGGASPVVSVTVSGIASISSLPPPS